MLFFYNREQRVSVLTPAEVSLQPSSILVLGAATSSLQLGVDCMGAGRTDDLPLPVILMKQTSLCLQESHFVLHDALCTFDGPLRLSQCRCIYTET